MTVTEIWKALLDGKRVEWVHSGYSIKIIDAYPNNEYQKQHFTNRNGKLLRVTCDANWFGSLLEESELNNCYVA